MLPSAARAAALTCFGVVLAHLTVAGPDPSLTLTATAGVPLVAGAAGVAHWRARTVARAGFRRRYLTRSSADRVLHDDLGCPQIVGIILEIAAPYQLARAQRRSDARGGMLIECAHCSLDQAAPLASVPLSAKTFTTSQAHLRRAA